VNRRSRKPDRQDRVARFGEYLNGPMIVPVPVRLRRPSAIIRRHIKVTRSASYALSKSVWEICTAVRPGWRATTVSIASDNVTKFPRVSLRHDIGEPPSSGVAEGPRLMVPNLGGPQSSLNRRSDKPKQQPHGTGRWRPKAAKLAWPGCWLSGCFQTAASARHQQHAVGSR
jgi:hypothetical protein